MVLVDQCSEPTNEADITVFDPQIIKSTATYNDPRHIPEGICAGIVGGQMVVEDRRIQDARPDRLLAPGA